MTAADAGSFGVAITRARPLLGTFARIEASFALEADAEAALAAAFAAVAHVHGAMSFHQPDSELSRLNRAAPDADFPVSSELFAVLRLALEVAAASGGAFDPVVAARRAVETGALPRPVGRAAAAQATWRDVRLSADDATVRLERPLWIDLGGIAKGWAVDAATAVLEAQGATAGWVDCGGDLRAFGRPLSVALDARAPHAPVPHIEISNAALASSGGLLSGERLAAQAHVDGRDGRELGAGFAAVVARDCAKADALAKVVLALGDAARPVLDRYGAHAYRLAPGREWATLEHAAAA